MRIRAHSVITAALIFVLTVQVALAVPKGFSAFFDASSCPPGWGELNVAEGRLIVSTSVPGNVGVTVNSPLSDQEDRSHLHSFSSTVNVPHRDIAAIGCCNNQGAAHGDYPVNNNTLTSDSGYPFTQLLLCTLQQEDSNPIAFGSVGYFDPEVGGCPANWQPMNDANGRILVPGYQQGGAVSNSAPSLQSGEDRAHAHNFDVTFPTTDVSYVGAEGCCDSGPANFETLTLAGTASNTSAGLPYVQLLTCVSQTATFNQTVPADALVFNAVACPPGWDVVNEVSGRLLVGLPSGGSPGASFGGSSLNPNATSNPTHAHTIEGSLNLPSVGVGLATGCCGSGYIGAGTYGYSGSTSTDTENMPYTMIPLCRYSANNKHGPKFIKQPKK